MAVLRAIVTESDALRPIDEIARQELLLCRLFITPKTANILLMARIFYVHWNESEALQRIAPLTDAGQGSCCP